LLCFAHELVHYWESGSVVFRHSNRHLNEIEAPIKNNGARQLRRDPGREMNVFAVHISAPCGQNLTRWSEPTWDTYNFSMFYRAGQEPIRRRTLHHSNLDTCTVNFVHSF